jgi:hypothetical protein
MRYRTKVAFVTALAASLVNCGQPGRVPEGQAALVEIHDNDLASLKTAFNAAADSVRVIVLMSPT